MWPNDYSETVEHLDVRSHEHIGMSPLTSLKSGFHERSITSFLCKQLKSSFKNR